MAEGVQTADGKIEAIMPDFVEIGVDVFNLNTPRLLGIEEFGRRFRGRSCFCIYVDLQRTAVSGSHEEIGFWREKGSP